MLLFFILASIQEKSRMYHNFSFSSRVFLLMCIIELILSLRCRFMFEEKEKVNMLIGYRINYLTDTELDIDRFYGLC